MPSTIVATRIYRSHGLIGLMLSISSAASGQMYDLTADWSDAQNPNGPWSYRAAKTPLPKITCWTPAPYANCQPAWAQAAGGPGHIPVVFKAVATPSAPFDWQTGDIVLHADDPSNGGAGVANVAWTSPICGTVDISGGVWLARDIGRSNAWSVLRNGETLTSGVVSTGDVYNRGSPFDLAAGSCGPDKLQDVIVAPGDVISLQFVRAGGSGEFAGMRFTIAATTGPCCKPCDANCDGSINQFDITPFISILTTHAACPSACAGDTNLNGTVNQFDIQGFVDCLTCD